MKNIIIILTLFLSFNLLAANDDEFKDMYLCFNISEVKLNIEYDRVRWPDSQFNDVCSINIMIAQNQTNPAYFYYSRNWRYPALCKKFLKDWSKLKKDKNRKVCIAARLGTADKEMKNGKEFLERSAPYEVIKSGKWCHGYFTGYCD